MKKDQADEFERELMQPLAQVLRKRLGGAGEVHVNNEPRLMTGERVEYATWLEVVLNDARTEVIFRPLTVQPPAHEHPHANGSRSFAK